MCASIRTDGDIVFSSFELPLSCLLFFSFLLFFFLLKCLCCLTLAAHDDDDDRYDVMPQRIPLHFYADFVCVRFALICSGHI